MSEIYIARIKKFSESLSDTNLVEHVRGIKGNTFSRNRKMPLKDILLCCLSKKGLTTALELRNYFKQKKDFSIKISKQGYLQQRKRLNPEDFTYLNNDFLYDKPSLSISSGTIRGFILPKVGNRKEISYA